MSLNCFDKFGKHAMEANIDVFLLINPDPWRKSPALGFSVKIFCVEIGKV